MRTLAENSVELRLAVQAKEMGRIQAAINAQVQYYDGDDDDNAYDIIKYYQILTNIINSYPM